jgi:hypothetical protein
MSFEDDGLSTIPAKAAQAAAALETLKAPAERAARSIDDAFTRAGTSLARSLARAAADGQVSLGELARAVLGAAGTALKGGLTEALSKSFSGANFSGARADGGPVLPGGAYLVGERGPEVFRPTSAGAIESAGSGGGVSVTVNVQGGEVSGLVRSDAQLAQALARAVSLGARRL